MNLPRKDLVRQVQSSCDAAGARGGGFASSAPAPTAPPRHGPKWAEPSISKICVRCAALTAKVTTRRNGRTEEDGCRDFLHEEGFVPEALLARFEDKNWGAARYRSRSPEVPSGPHPWQDAAVSPRGTCVSGWSLRCEMKHRKGSNTSSPRSGTMRIPRAKSPQHTNSCAVDLRNGSEAAFQERFRTLVAFTI